MTGCTGFTPAGEMLENPVFLPKTYLSTSTRFFLFSQKTYCPLLCAARPDLCLSLPCLGLCRFVILSETVHVVRAAVIDIYRNADGFRQNDKARRTEAYTETQGCRAAKFLKKAGLAPIRKIVAQFASTYFLKLSKMACQPPRCNSTEFSVSASKDSTTSVSLPLLEKVMSTFRLSPSV